MADVFISYKRDDRDRVAAIAARLRDLKVDVWFDENLRSGAAFVSFEDPRRFLIDLLTNFRRMTKEVTVVGC
jgi:hypothetical protein